MRFFNSQNAQFPIFKSCMFNILSLTPSITEFIQGSSNFIPTFIEINIKRKSVFRSFRNYISDSKIINLFVLKFQVVI